MKKITAAAVLLALILLCAAGCIRKEPDREILPETGGGEETGSASTDADFSKDDDDMFTDRDINADYSGEECITVTLENGNSSASSDSVIITDDTVRLTKEATYIISGRLDNGTVIVDVGDGEKPRIVLAGADISSVGSAALYVINAGKVVVTLAEGTENRLASSGEFIETEEGVDGAIYSKEDLSFNGKGSLSVEADQGHGIVCKDDLVFVEGSYTVSASSHGINANDSVRIKSAELNITAGKDGIKCENNSDTSLGFVYVSGGSIGISSDGDGIASGAYVQIEGGSFDIVSGGGSENGEDKDQGGFGGGGRPRGFFENTEEDDGTSRKGIKAASGVLIEAGTFKFDTADDSVHSDTSVTVNGGELEIKSGDDGIHAEKELKINGGTVDIKESYEGIEGASVLIAGGKISIIASDDGINASDGTSSGGFPGGGGRPGGHGRASYGSSCSVVISGGEIFIKASADGIDSNGTLTVEGGYTVVTGPTVGDTSVIDSDGAAVITGGTFVGTGSVGMGGYFTDASQGILLLRSSGGNVSKEITVLDKDGSVLLSHAPELSYNVFIFSCPELISGQSYEVRFGTDSNEYKAN